MKEKTKMNMLCRKLAMLAVAATTLLTGGVSWAAEEQVALEFGGRSANEIRLPVGRSQIITSPVALEQVVIGSPEVADIKLLSAGRVLILGIKPGRTNLVFRQKGGDLVALMDVVVGYDLNGIKKRIFDGMPSEDRLQVRDSNDKLILAGEVSSAYAMDMALNVARSYVPADKVINLMQVSGGSQVLLEVRIAEIDRNSLKGLGVETSLSDAGGDFQFNGPTLITATNRESVTFGDTLWTPEDSGMLDSLSFKIRALETKGLAKTLAEPNLVALSGQEANFLAGGEIPIPVYQTSTTGSGITIEYKEFGVGLRFTPTVLDASKINLKLLSEVSSLGTTAYSLGTGVNIPSINTSRAGTTIELADGQSFAIAGLMQSNMNNAIRQVPLLGSIPVLGALFRSSDYQREETELVVLVTAHLVKPTDASHLALPTDVFVPPSAIDQYLLGRLEGTPKERGRAKDKEDKRSGREGGMEGPVGHQVKAENPAAPTPKEKSNAK